MPTYVYECPRCGEFEVRHSISEPARERCPTCGAAIRRVIAGGTSFIVKGRGAATR
jgi:putative FmdB family regulatory protein